MTIVSVPGPGTEGALTIMRKLTPGKRWTPEHVHLDFAERFEIVSGIADLTYARDDRRRAADEVLYVPAGVVHRNPRNRDIAELVYRQTFIPATEGARSYVRTLAQVLRDGRDEDGELPWSLVLAIGHVTRERTYARRLPYALQRKVLLPVGSRVAGTRGFDVQLPRKPAAAPSAERRREVRSPL
jgi:mannose-6-phosphate isomerase-like protein (cupin superfamily)